MCTPPESSARLSYLLMCAGCGSLPTTLSWYAVPGAFIERTATPFTAFVNRPAPMSQSDFAAVCFSLYCFTRMPKTSEKLLVQRARLVVVFERGAELRHAMRQLVTDDVERPVKRLNSFPSPSPYSICSPVPVRVAVRGAEVHGGIETEPFAVDRVAAVDLLVEIVGDAGAFVRFVRRDVVRRLRAFAANELSGEVALSLRVVNRAPLSPWRATARRRSDRMLFARRALPPTARACRPRVGALLVVTVLGDVREDVRRNDAADM